MKSTLKRILALQKSINKAVNEQLQLAESEELTLDESNAVLTVLSKRENENDITIRLELTINEF